MYRTLIDPRQHINLGILRQLFLEFIQEQRAKPILCPQCGGPVTITDAAPVRCDYCDTTLRGIVAVDYHTRIARVDVEGRGGEQNFRLPIAGGVVQVYLNGMLLSPGESKDYVLHVDHVHLNWAITNADEVTLTVIDGPGVVAF